MEKNTNTREAVMYDQIAKLQGSSTEAIKTVTTSAGDTTITVSGTTDYDDIANQGGSAYERPYVYQVRIDLHLPEPVATKFGKRRFQTAVEAYEFGVKVARTYADKVHELSAVLDA